MLNKCNSVSDKCVFVPYVKYNRLCEKYRNILVNIKILGFRVLTRAILMLKVKVWNRP